MTSPWTWSVFTKVWGALSASELAELVSGLGFSAIELPVRQGCQVTPDTALAELPAVARALGERGVTITSVAADLDERVLAACAAAGVPLVRIMPRIEGPYRAAVRALQQHLADSVALVERHGVRVGLQHHHGPFLTTAIVVRELLDPLPDCYGVIWDAGHEGLAGQDLVTSLEAVRDRLVQVNLKNAIRQRISVEDELGSRESYGRHVWVDGPDGFADWPRAVACLAGLNWHGTVCLCAEYSGDQSVTGDRVAADLVWAQSLVR